jgi:hypothetical protein
VVPLSSRKNRFGTKKQTKSAVKKAHAPLHVAIETFVQQKTPGPKLTLRPVVFGKKDAVS